MNRAHGIAIALVLACAGCHGAPAPKAVAPPVAKTTTTAAVRDSGCDELRTTLAGVEPVVDETKDAKPTKTPAETTKTDANSKAPRVPVLELRSLRSVERDLTTLDAALVRAAASDALREPAGVARANVARAIDATRRAAKLLETEAAPMAAAIADISSADAPLTEICSSVDDPDCAAAKLLYSKMIGAPDDPTAIDQAVAAISAISFRSPKALAARDRIVRALGTMAKHERELAKHREEIAAAQDKTVIDRAVAPLTSTCHLDEVRGQNAKTGAPSWRTVKTGDLRKMVVVVRVDPDTRIASRLRDWANQSVGERREGFLAASQGGFGSGFFVVPKDGEALVVTNRHVVEGGDRAVVETSDGTTAKAEVLYTDPVWDIAVLRPERALVDAGLPIEPEAARDHQGVIATGYPAVGGKPSYQTTRGHVSNQSFLALEDGVAYVQHTAAIDPGNSGGPLTTEQGTVIGVNTLKLAMRENVALAVPAPAIVRAVTRARSTATDAASLRASARDACLDILAELSDAKLHSPALETFVANSMVADIGAESFNVVHRYDRVLDRLILLYPATALRRAVAQRLVGTAANINPFETCSQPVRDDWDDIVSMDRVRFVIGLAGAGSTHLVLRREHGAWKMMRFDISSPKPMSAPPLSAPPPPAKKPAKKPPRKP